MTLHFTLQPSDCPCDCEDFLANLEDHEIGVIPTTTEPTTTTSQSTEAWQVANDDEVSKLQGGGVMSGVIAQRSCGLQLMAGKTILTTTQSTEPRQVANDDEVSKLQGGGVMPGVIAQRSCGLQLMAGKTILTTTQSTEPRQVANDDEVSKLQGGGVMSGVIAQRSCGLQLMAGKTTHMVESFEDYICIQDFLLIYPLNPELNI